MEDTTEIPTNLGINTEMDAVQSEKMVPQSKVDEIVRHAYAKAIEKGRNEGMSNQAQVQQPSMQDSYNSSSPDAIQKLVAAESKKYHDAMIEQARHETSSQDAKRLAGEFFQKLENGVGKYDDFSDSVGNLPFAEIAPVIHLANQMENTDDVMYELAKNPMKLANLMQLSQFSSPHLVQQEMRKLSESIRSNADAKRSEMSNEPLRQLKSSPNSIDNGNMSVSDYRKIYR